MQRSAGHLSARAVRLLKKYFCDVLYVGFCVALLGGISQRSDGSGDLSWMEIYAFVGPGAFVWAVTGSNWYGSWASALYLGAVLLLGGVWLAPWVSSLAFLGLGSVAVVIAARRADGWTFCGAVRSVLVKAGQWLQVQLPVVGQLSAVGFDRPNTFGENFVMGLVWVSVLGLSFWPAAVVGDFFLSISAAMEGAVGAER